jgi:hypothetical protein
VEEGAGAPAAAPRMLWYDALVCRTTPFAGAFCGDAKRVEFIGVIGVTAWLRTGELAGTR